MRILNKKHIFLIWILLYTYNNLWADVFIRSRPITPFRPEIKTKTTKSQTPKNYWANKYFEKKQYIRAAYLDKLILKKDSKNIEAKEELALIQEINPYWTKGLNEIGLFSQNVYVSDLNAIWDFSSAFVRRDTAWGSALATANFANRFGQSATQGQVVLSPVINKRVFFDMFAAYANNPILFPNYIMGGEGYLTNTLPADFSLGASYQYIASHIAFIKYTASISKEFDKIWFIFRPYYFNPLHGKSSVLFTFKAIRYIDTYDHFLSLNIGSGHSIDLADFETVNFLVIRNRFITANYQTPIFNHAATLNIGGEFTQWAYPFGLIRNLMGANIGLTYRF